MIDKTYLKLVLAVSIICCSQMSAHAATMAEIAGVYQNRSESEFIYDLTLKTDGTAVWQDPNHQGGKPLILKGNWKLSDSAVELIVSYKGKPERYVYQVNPKLSWSAFGCKGETFGLANRGTAKRKSGDGAYDVWRKADIKNSDKCTRV